MSIKELCAERERINNEWLQAAQVLSQLIDHRLDEVTGMEHYGDNIIVSGTYYCCGDTDSESATVSLAFAEEFMLADAHKRGLMLGDHRKAVQAAKAAEEQAGKERRATAERLRKEKLFESLKAEFGK